MEWLPPAGQPVTVRPRRFVVTDVAASTLDPDPLDYQLDSVVHALQMPRANLLIADDVELRRGTEVGIVLQELILRHGMRAVRVVCPAGLAMPEKS